MCSKKEVFREKSEGERNRKPTVRVLQGWGDGGVKTDELGAKEEGNTGLFYDLCRLRFLPSPERAIHCLETIFSGNHDSLLSLGKCGTELSIFHCQR